MATAVITGFRRHSQPALVITGPGRPGHLNRPETAVVIARFGRRPLSAPVVDRFCAGGAVTGGGLSRPWLCLVVAGLRRRPLSALVVTGFN
jgi:hypothetical protein